MAFEKITALMQTKAVTLPTLYQNNLPFKTIGNDITYYPQDTGQTFIEKGYNLNDAIFSIVGKNADKFGQPDIYHMVIKTSERKTAMEYRELKSKPLTSYSAKELKRMVKAMVENQMPDSKLARLLRRPNRFQSQSEWMEQLFGFKELTGEANLLFNRGLTDGPPLEMFIIPKPHLNIIIDPGDPWQITAFEIVIGTNRRRVDKQDMVMWKYPNYLPLDNPEHLRGQAPLESARILMQGMNEADERMAISNKNAGASGLAFLKNLPKPTIEQSADIRRQFNNAVNNSEMAAKIAILGGEWGYINFGYSMDQLRVLEQNGLGFDRLCHVFKTPPGIFRAEGTWDNQKQFERKWIYSKIIPCLSQFCGILNDVLLKEFSLDPETNLIDFAPEDFQELSEDLKEQIAAVQNAWWLTPNQKLSATGYEESTDPNMSKVYVPSGFQPLDELNMPVGGDLSQEMQDLNA